MSTRARLFAAVLLVSATAALVACTSGDDDVAENLGTTSTSARTGYVSDTYLDESAWLCLPGTGADACDTADLTATEWLRDGATAVVPSPPAAETGLDCFYAYPTVDLLGPPGNSPMDGDPAAALDAVKNEAAWFRSVCRVFAPRYPQVTAAGSTAAEAPQYQQVAYDGLLDAFRHYLDQESDGRPFVLIGDGQGADLLTRLIQEQIDGNADLQPRMVSAVLAGTGRVVVPEGQPVGGTFRTIPLCLERGQVGCVITWTMFGFGTSPTASSPLFAGVLDGMVTACANPSGLDGSKGQYRGATFPTSAADPARWVPGDLLTADTPFVIYGEYFRGECVDGPGPIRYVRVDLVTDPSDQRSQPALGGEVADAVGGGLQAHVVQLALGDLLFLVGAQADAAGLGGN